MAAIANQLLPLLQKSPEGQAMLQQAQSRGLFEKLGAPEAQAKLAQIGQGGGPGAAMARMAQGAAGAAPGGVGAMGQAGPPGTTMPVGPRPVAPGMPTPGGWNPSIENGQMVGGGYGAPAPDVAQAGSPAPAVGAQMAQPPGSPIRKTMPVGTPAMAGTMGMAMQNYLGVNGPQSPGPKAQLQASGPAPETPTGRSSWGKMGGG